MLNSVVLTVIIRWIDICARSSAGIIITDNLVVPDFGSFEGSTFSVDPVIEIASVWQSHKLQWRIRTVAVRTVSCKRLIGV